MASASPKKSSSKNGAADQPPVFRSQALAEALEHQDMAAVALALRNGNTVVPLLKAGDPENPLDNGEVWTFRSPETGEIALLLFSDAVNKPANLPPLVGLYSPEWLRAFLGANAELITTVFLDIAGPHPMQATPNEILRALDV